LGTFFSISLWGCTGSDAPSAMTIRQTQFGAVEGIVQMPGSTGMLAAGEGFAWLGVSYAKPPVGNLRWKPPVDPDSWTGSKKAQASGQACAQVGSMYGPPSFGSAYETAANVFWKPVGSEDCLYLNIYSPITSQAGSKLPVFFFIHGGSNRVGAASLFDGSVLAKNTNSIVVFVGYRLNLFGWLTHPALRTGEPLNDSGNYGLLDIIQALKFVKNNISNFGGDPNNVTISGQSAGALNVNSLILSPVAAGLFHKAMPMSGDTTYSTVARFRQLASRWPEEAWSVVLEISDPPDSQGCMIVGLRLLVGDAPESLLEPGSVFELFEGRRHVATGEILG